MLSDVDGFLDEFKSKLGLDFVPSLFHELRHRPHILLPFCELIENTLLSGEMDRSEKELIFIVTANEKFCRYCSVAHKAMAKQLGVKSTILEYLDTDLRFITPLTLQKILEFARCLASNNPQNCDTVLTDLKQLGVADSVINEIIEMVSAASLAITLANGLNLNERVDEGFFKLLHKA